MANPGATCLWVLFAAITLGCEGSAGKGEGEAGKADVQDTAGQSASGAVPSGAPNSGGILASGGTSQGGALAGSPGMGGASPILGGSGQGGSQVNLGGGSLGGGMVIAGSPSSGGSPPGGGGALFAGGGTDLGGNPGGGEVAWGGSSGSQAIGGAEVGGAAGSSSGGVAGGAQGGSAGIAGGFETGGSGGARFPFPQNIQSDTCVFPTNYDNAEVKAAYELWKNTVITSEGAGGYLRVKKPDSGNVIGSTVSEGIGYGMILAVYAGDQELFDKLWQYEQLHLNSRGLMDWEIDPEGNVTSEGSGAASDGDEDMAWALVMAERQWGGQGSLPRSYLDYAIELIELIYTHEVDVGRGYMLKAGDQWGDVDVTNPSYFAPAYYRVFAEVTGRQEWLNVVDSSYDIIEKSLNAQSGNQDNGLVPAWCDSSGTPVEAYSGAPLYFQNDSTRTPFRVGQDYCYFGEPRAKAYLEKIVAFYEQEGVENIVDGYELDGTPRPERATAGGLQAASFVGPAGVGAMNDVSHQVFLDAAYAAVASQELTAGTIYYQKCWMALSLFMMTGNLAVFPAR